MSAMLYTVLAASGGFVNGAEVTIGADVALTEPEARYEIALGSVSPTGRAPVLPIVPTLLSDDILAGRRGARDRDVLVASLENFLIRDGGLLAAALQARGDDVAVYLTEQMESVRDAIRGGIIGGADVNSDTLGKLAARLALLAQALAAEAGTRAQGDIDLAAALRGGVGADYDTLAKLAAGLTSLSVDGIGGLNAALAAIGARIDAATAIPVRQRYAADSFTLVGGATSLAVAGGYTPGLLTVYRNGGIADDATATDGTNVVFAAPLAADDIVHVRGVKVGPIADVAPSVHRHDLAEVLGLVAALASKASNGANHDITSLSGLVTPVPQAARVAFLAAIVDVLGDLPQSEVGLSVGQWWMNAGMPTQVKSL